MMGPPLLLLADDRFSFTRTTSVAAAVALVILLPLALFVRRRPQCVVVMTVCCRHDSVLLSWPGVSRPPVAPHRHPVAAAK